MEETTVRILAHILVLALLYPFYFAGIGVCCALHALWQDRQRRCVDTRYKIGMLLFWPKRVPEFQRRLYGLDGVRLRWVNRFSIAALLFPILPVLCAYLFD